MINPERLAFLPNTKLCVSCASTHGPKKYKGCLNFAHKTAGTIMVMDADFFDKEWRKYQPTFGNGSGVVRMSPKISGTA